jgi:FKBP-type peptidyl-prolyl cis-trans isomerase FkpA
MTRFPCHPFAALFCVLALGCGSDIISPTSPDDPLPVSPPTAPYSQTDLRVGSGAEAVKGYMVTVIYTGWVYDPSRESGKGAMFDTNVGGRWTYPFLLGAGQASPGWDRGVLGMRVGGLRRLVLPPELGYGGRPAIAASVPPQSTLVYEIELDDCWDE